MPVTARAVEVEVLDFGAERVVDVGLRPGRCRRSAIARCFGHHVADIVDEVDVVAVAADHGVGAKAAIQRVVAAKAAQRVGEIAAGDDVVGALPVPTNWSASTPV